MNEIDETLIQRCIDNELSAGERRQLLTRLDAVSDGWKSLACGFIEEQLFADAVISETPAIVPTTTNAPTASRHWFGHPVTSLVLSIGVAFLAGVLVHGEFGGASAVSIAEKDQPGGESGGNVTTVSRPDNGEPDSNIKVRLVGDGIESQVLPFYEADDYTDESDRAWKCVSEYIEERRNGQNRRTQMIVLKIGGQTYIIPVEELETTSPFQ